MDTAGPAYVRELLYIPQDDPRYLAGNDMSNRVEPPPDEVPGDGFDRQRCIVGFNQRLVEQQDCLVLGAGGVGQNVGLMLARLGVRSIAFVDHEVYEASNLSRQVLGSAADVGRRKVDVATANVQFHCIPRLACGGTSTRVEGHHLDAVAQWASVVALARRSTVIFNCIDVGSVFDFAVNSLSKALELPLVQGQSASWSFNAEFYTGQPGHQCYACANPIRSSFAFEGRALDDIRARHAAAAAATAAAGEHDDAAALTPAALLRFLRDDKQYRIDGDTARLLVEEAAADAATDAADSRHLGPFLRRYYDLALARLLPDAVVHQSDLLFAPRPRGVPTRYVGSWVCPCIGVASFMVAQLVNYLTGPTARDPPTSMQMSLASGRTDLCEAALECGFVDPPTQARDASTPTCPACAATAGRVEAGLFYSLLPVSLDACAGSAWARRSDSSGRSSTGDGANDGAQPYTGVTVQRRGLLWRDIDCLGPEYQYLALDAPPAGPAVEDGQAWVPAHQDAAWPAELARPLVKRLAGRGAVPAYASGVRSALLRVPHDGPPGTTTASTSTTTTWYRLKGCGAADTGFTVVPVVDDTGKPVCADGHVLKQIRGAAYPHTCAIEQAMTARVDALLADVGMVGANRPLGRFDYDLTAPRVEFPLVTRSCGLFVCRGDRRLGDHVLRGLEMLLPLLFTADGGERHHVAEAAARALTAAMPAAAPVGADDDPEAWDEYDERLPKAALLYGGGARAAPEAFAYLRQPTDVPLPPPVPGGASTRGASFPVGAPKALTCVWDKCWARLAAACPSPSHALRLLADVYWRCGRDCGAVGRALRLGGVVWGAYRDATGCHMNAHANNLVLLPDTVRTPAEALLAPLDFDMAYTKDACDTVGTQDGDGGGGGGGDAAASGTLFEESSEDEFSQLGFNLAASQASAASTSTGTQAPVEVPRPLGVVRLALRHTLVKGWLTAAQGLADAPPPGLVAYGQDADADTAKAAARADMYALLKLALILTWDVVA